MKQTLARNHRAFGVTPPPAYAWAFLAALACILPLAIIGALWFSGEPMTKSGVVPALVVVPAVFIAAATYLVINALVTDPKWTSITFAVVLAGLPVYYVWFSGAERRPEDVVRSASQ